MAAASSGDIPVNKGRNPASCLQWAKLIIPAASARATTAIPIRWDIERALNRLLNWFIAVLQRSNLHTHDFFVCGDNLVPRLHEHLELEFSILHGENCGV